MTQRKTNEELQSLFLDHIASYALHVDCLMDGPSDREIVIIGEYPGANEAALKKPFSGGSGKILWNALRKQGISRVECYSTNVIKRQVSAKHTCDARETSLWQEALHYELSLLTDTKLYIALGNTVLETLCNLQGVNHHRGSVYKYNDIPVVVCNNPALCLRMPETEIIFMMDIEKAINIYKGDFKEHKITKIINPRYEDAMDYIEAIRKEHKKFTVDIETTNYETACLGLGISATEAMCINFRDADSNRFTAEQEFNILQSFITTCDDPSTFVIAQNGNFDSHFMGFKDYASFKVDFDTLLAHHTLYPRLPHNLGFLTSQYTSHAYYKDDIKIFKEGGDVNTFWEYNATDCAITFAVYEAELRELKEQKLDEFFFNHVMRIQPHLIRSTVNGVAIDLQRRAKLSESLREDLVRIEEETLKYARIAVDDDSYQMNLNSPKQVGHYLFDVLGIPTTVRSVNESTRKAILVNPKVHVEVKDFLTKYSKYQEERKFFSTYVETRLDEDNRFRSEFKQYGVSKAPGRLSSSSTLWGTGGNAQNLPARALEMFIADPGCVFIYFDLAQAEARYVAWDAWIEHWISDFERARLEGGFDAHRSLASTMFNVPYDDVPKDDWLDKNGLSQKHPDCDHASLKYTMRFVAKRCRHGLNYRMQPARLAETTGMAFHEAARHYYTYHQTNPELQIWWKDVEKEIRRNRMLFNAFGRRMIVLERLENSDTMDSIIAFKPQSTIGDKVQRVWYQCHEDPEWDMRRAEIRRNVHDALWGVVTPDFAMKALSIMKKYAEEPIMVKRTKDGRVNPMIVPADCKISIPDEFGVHRMSKMKDVEVEV